MKNIQVSLLHGKYLILLLLISVLPGLCMPVSAEMYDFVEVKDSIPVPSSIMKMEQSYDLFDAHTTGKKDFTTLPYDLNGDQKPEYFVSNANNNGLYGRFWRIYQQEGKGFKAIGQMACTGIKVDTGSTNPYNDIYCYKASSVVEGILSRLVFFADCYVLDKQYKATSREFYGD